MRKITCILADLERDASGSTDTTSTCWAVFTTCVEVGGGAARGEGGLGGGGTAERSYKGGRPLFRLTDRHVWGISSCLRFIPMQAEVETCDSNCFSLDSDLQGRRRLCE